MDMETIMNFLADNYKWFMIAAGVLLLALIGFLVSGKKKKGSDAAPSPIPQTDYSQMGTIAQMQDAQAQPQPTVIQNVSEPQVETQVQPQGVQDTIFTGAPVNNEMESEKLIIEAPSGALNSNPNMDAMGMEEPSTPVAPEPVFEPVTPVANESLVIEEPAPAAPIEAAPLSPVEPMPAEPTPVAPVSIAEPVVPAPVVEPTPVAPAPVMEEPVMSAPVEEMPISMMPEEPAPAPVAPEPVPVAPAPAAPEVNLQNTIQQ